MTRHFCDVCATEMNGQEIHAGPLHDLKMTHICESCMNAFSNINLKRMWISAIMELKAERCPEEECVLPAPEGASQRKPWKCPHCGKFIAGGIRV